MDNCNLQILVQLHGAKLCDIVNMEGEWNWEALHDWLPVHISMKIEAMRPPKEEYGADILLCNNEKNGAFSISTMYHAL